ncbi:phosphotransferase RcsD [Serratia sp. DD3]|nr:phosphotransferase RcsD [Serratia sp. DD3]KEY60399.1 phosphotransferase RcsD [Serratia sp. DD3]
MLQNRQSPHRSRHIIRSFWLQSVLLVVALILYGYNYTNAYLADKKKAIIGITAAVQSRIDNYRYLTQQIYTKFGNPTTPVMEPEQKEKLLNADVYYLDKKRNKTDVLIFGNHSNDTLAMISNISNFLDSRWGTKKENYTLYYLNGRDNSLSLVTTQSIKDLTSRLKENYLTALASELRAEILQQTNMLDKRESFSGLRKQRFQGNYSFSIRTTFNQPGHLATVLAFELPINDIIPLNMARSNFLLLDDNDEFDNITAPDAEQHQVTTTLHRGWLEFTLPLSNAPLKLIYRVSIFNLVIDLLRNNIWLLVVNLLLLMLSIIGFYFIRHQYIRPSENMAVELEKERSLTDEIINNLTSGLIVYDFASNRAIASNKIADHLRPHLNLKKIAHMAKQHHGVIQATVNNKIYEIRLCHSQRSAETYLFLLDDQKKEMVVNKRLQQAQHEYDKTVQARQLMLQNLAVELNQPINQINNLVGRLNTQPEPQQQQSLLKQLSQTSTSVLDLIDNIILLTRLETQDIQPSYQLFSPAVLLDELLLDLLPLIEQKGLTLFHHFHLDAGQHYIGDANILRKVISLLLRYAIITTSYGKIVLSVEYENDHPEHLLFHINDTGSGISSDELSNLTYPFLSQMREDRFNHGSGLTFFLCNRLCKALNGDLSIRSKLDIGTRYTIRVTMELEKPTEEAEEKLLDGIKARLDITSNEVRSITTHLLEAYGASYLIADERQNNQAYDIVITDDPQLISGYTLLLASDETGCQQLGEQIIRVNYNFTGAMLDAITQLIELQLAEENHEISLTEDDIQHYKKQLKTSNYIDLFVDTVPVDIKKLYTAKEHSDFAALSQTAHRLKGAFAMLNLLPGKQLCESLERHIAEGDALKIDHDLSQIDFFISRLLEEGSQQHE